MRDDTQISMQDATNAPFPHAERGSRELCPVTVQQFRLRMNVGRNLVIATTTAKQGPGRGVKRAEHAIVCGPRDQRQRDTCTSSSEIYTHWCRSAHYAVLRSFSCYLRPLHTVLFGAVLQYSLQECATLMALCETFCCATETNGKNPPFSRPDIYL